MFRQIRPKRERKKVRKHNPKRYTSSPPQHNDWAIWNQWCSHQWLIGKYSQHKSIMSPQVEVCVSQKMVTSSSYDNTNDPSLELGNDHVHANDTQTRINWSTLNGFNPARVACVTSKELCVGTVFLNILEVSTVSSEHIVIDNFDQPPNTSKGRHKFVALITDSRQSSWSHHCNH